MRKKGLILLFSVCMLGLAACGEKQDATGISTSRHSQESVQIPVTEPTEAPVPTAGTESAEVSASTSVAESTEAVEPITSTTPESEAEARSWVQVQEELEQQGLQYVGYYTLTMERLDVMVEDGTELIFLYNTDATTDETDMWIDYNQDRKPEEYTLVMENDTFYGDVFEQHYLVEAAKGSNAYYQPDASQLWGESIPYTMGLTGLELSQKQLYAKYGLTFEDSFWNAVFQQKDWYEPKYTAEEFVEGKVYQLTDTEKENLQLLQKLQSDFQGNKAEGDKGLVPIASGSWLDLDGDGSKEQVLYEKNMEDEDFATVTVTVQSKQGQVSVEEVYPGVHAACYLADREDQGSLLGIAMDGISADYGVVLLQYENGQLSNLGQVPSGVEEMTIQGNTFSGNVESYHLQCQPVIREYTVKSGKLIEVEKDNYEYRGNTVTVLKSVPLYAEPEAAQACGLLEEGETVAVLGGDLKEWVQLEIGSTGEKYWIRVEGHDCYLPDGTTDFSGNVFEGLTFYG